MVASCPVLTPPASLRPPRKGSIPLRPRQSKPVRALVGPSGWEPVLGPALVVGLWLFAAAVVAPEQPQNQAAICQRHNGPEACRVW